MAKKQVTARQVAKRLYWREADARAVLAEWRSTGESLTRFAQRHGIERSRLARWLKRLDEKAPMVLHPVRVLETSLDEGNVDGRIEIGLVQGACVRVSPGFRSDDLRRVLTVLAESAQC